MIRGSVVVVRRLCGKANYRCASTAPLERTQTVSHAPGRRPVHPAAHQLGVRPQEAHHHRDDLGRRPGRAARTTPTTGSTATATASQNRRLSARVLRHHRSPTRRCSCGWQPSTGRSANR